MKSFILPYIPNVQKIFDSFDYIIGKQKDSEDVKNDYISFLLEYKLIYINDEQIYEIGNEGQWLMKPYNERIMGFREFIFRMMPMVQQLYGIIEKHETKYESLPLLLEKQYSDQDIRVVVSWLEFLNIIRYKDDYISLNLNDNEYDDYSTSESIYPLDYNTEINIKEDKFSIFEYVRKIKRDDIILNPDFQRNLVWKIQQKSQFIESAILNIPIPPIYLKRNPDGRLIVVDGLQRTSAILSFLNNDFALTGLEALSKLNGYTFTKLQESPEFKNLSARIEDKQLFFYVLDRSVPMSLVYDIFNRINTGGTKLERQEIRNCIFIGKSTRLLQELSESKIFRDAIGDGISSLRMKDREAILRCISFTIQDYKTEYKDSMDEFLENAMRKLNNSTSIVLEDIKNNFLKIMDLSYKIFREKNFRIPTPTTKGRINIAVMESVFYCINILAREQRRINSEDLQKSFNNMLNDNNYISAVRFSTGNRNNVISRFDISIYYLLNNK